MRYRGVNDNEPKGAEQQYGTEFDALGIRADDERRRDDRERHLEHKEHAFGYISRQSLLTDTGEESFLKTANPRTAVGECQTVANGEPQDRCEASDRETMH